MAATTRKKLGDKDQITDEDREPGVVYIGHVPHGFYEAELLKYFSQFGKVLNIKLSRSKKNGKSKGYAFIKFQYAAVAKTVAETCHNYLFFNKLLKCEYKPLSEVHADTFFSYKWKPGLKRKRQHNSAKPEDKLQKSLERSTRKQQKKLDKLKELGVDLKLEDIMDVPPALSRRKSKGKNEDSSTPLEVSENISTAVPTTKTSKKPTKGGKKSITSTTQSPKVVADSGSPEKAAAGLASKTNNSRPLKRKRPGAVTAPAESKQKKTGVKRSKK